VIKKDQVYLEHILEAIEVDLPLLKEIISKI